MSRLTVPRDTYVNRRYQFSQFNATDAASQSTVADRVQMAARWISITWLFRIEGTYFT
jgi:hypothetical protein